jgi:hypothetical protein
MGAEDNGLTLEALAHKLETQTQRLEALERENTELRSKVATLEGSETRRDELAELGGSGARRDGEQVPTLEGRVSRRSLLSKSGAAAVAAMAAGTLLSPREAKAGHYDDGIEVNWIATHALSSHAESVGFEAIDARNTASDKGAVYAQNSGSGAGVRALGGTGVWGSSATLGHSGVYGQHTATAGYGVVGDGNGDTGAGVLGRNPDGTGVHGKSPKTGYGAITGEHTGTSGYGVIGLGKGSSAGVIGRSPGGTGVRGEGSTTAEVAGVRGLGKTGVWGSSSATGYSGLYGQHTGSAGYGVVGDGTGATGAGVIGRNPNGPGVEGRASVYGGKFAGSRAQLLLVPKTTAGKPTTGAHTKGEISMDSTGALFVCTGGGTPGTWRKVTTTAA